MRRSSADGSSYGEVGDGGGPERVVGGADDVQKTSYVVGHGTDPDAPETHAPTATVRAGEGFNLGVWAVAAVAILVALVYGFGLLT